MMRISPIEAQAIGIRHRQHKFISGFAGTRDPRPATEEKIWAKHSA
jgi:hypothetical protein